MSVATERSGVLRAQAFGVPFRFLAGVEVPGLPGRADGIEAAETIVRNDPSGVSAAWAQAQPTRTHEIRRGDRLLMSVDRDDSLGYLLQANGIGAALVSGDGLEVRCAPDPAASDWSALLVGQVLPLVATLRGFEVFHAAGVVLDGSAHLLSGVQGIGKTSIATHLVVSGGELLSDDVVAVDDDLMAYAGSTSLKLRAPELLTLPGAQTGRLRALGDIAGRTTFAAPAAAGPQPLGGLHLLERADEGPAIERLLQPSPLELLGATFNLSVQTPERLQRHLELCSQLAERIPVFRVRIIPGHSAAELASAIRAYLLTTEARP